MSEQTSDHDDHRAMIMVALLGTLCLLAVIGCLKLGAEVYLLTLENQTARNTIACLKNRTQEQRPPQRFNCNPD